MPDSDLFQKLFLALAPHPACALLAGLLVRRRGGDWAAGALLGFLLTWGALPLVFWLTREPRPDVSSGLGLTSGEPHGPDHDWDEWRCFYFNLRQDLTIGAIYLVLLLVCLLWMAGLWLTPTWPEMPSARLIEGLWWTWPSLAGLLLQLGYKTPWLGPVWRQADEIWLNSGLDLPAEVRLRTRGRARGHSPESCSTSDMLDAARRAGAIYSAVLYSWLSLVLGLSVISLLAAYTARHHG